MHRSVRKPPFAIFLFLTTAASASCQLDDRNLSGGKPASSQGGGLDASAGLEGGPPDAGVEARVVDGQPQDPADQGSGGTTLNSLTDGGEFTQDSAGAMGGSNDNADVSAEGNDASAGGYTGIGGNNETGGTPRVGGHHGTGGSGAVGGSSGTGGSGAVDGSSGTGGSGAADASSGTGGSVAVGGSSGTGGLAGVGGRQGTGGQTGGPDVGGTTQTDSGGLGGSQPTLPCALQRIQGTGSPLATGKTTDGTDSFTGSCGTGAAPDIAFEWIVPQSDYYSVNTTGSNFDTLLYLRDNACNGSELACNNNAATSTQSEILAHFSKDQRVLVVVDGYAGDQGQVVLNAERIDCPSIDLTSQTFPLTLSTAGGSNTHTGACGGDGKVERAYRFTPQTSGLYSITAQSTEFQPAIYLEKGPRCGGQLLGCNQSTGASARDYPAEVIRYLTAGDPLTIIVDGGSGFFTLNVGRIDEGASATTCSPSALPGGSVSLALRGTSHSTASCAPAGSTTGLGAGPYPLPDDVYDLPVQVTGSAEKTYRIVSSSPVNVYLLGSGCSGPEKLCVTTTQSGTDYVATFSLYARDNGDYTMVVERALLLEGINLSYTIASMLIP